MLIGNFQYLATVR